MKRKNMNRITINAIAIIKSTNRKNSRLDSSVPRLFTYRVFDNGLFTNQMYSTTFVMHTNIFFIRQVNGIHGFVYILADLE